MVRVLSFLYSFGDKGLLDRLRATVDLPVLLLLLLISA
jgi:hypothetical protein